MNIETLENIVHLAKTVGYAFIATTNFKKVAHISMVSDVDVDFQGRLEVTGWFCQFASANLEVNKNVTVVVWDPRNDVGYQIITEMERVDEVERIDGYAFGLEKERPMPQVERMLHLKVHKILDFKKAPHMDVEMKG